MRRRGRLAKLEAKRREWEAAHVPRSDLPGFLFTVLGAVEREAGPDAAARVGARVVEGQAARVLDALAGKTAAQLEEIGQRVGLPVAELAGLSAPELARLYLSGWPA